MNHDDYFILEYLVLADTLPEWLLTENDLVVDDAERPYIHLRGDGWRQLSHLEALGWQVPVRSHTLRGEFEARLLVLQHLTQPEIG